MSNVLERVESIYGRLARTPPPSRAVASFMSTVVVRLALPSLLSGVLCLLMVPCAVSLSARHARGLTGSGRRERAREVGSGSTLPKPRVGELRHLRRPHLVPFEGLRTRALPFIA